MIAPQQSLATAKLLLSQAATLCRKQRKELLVYLIEMALAELDSELADANGTVPASSH